MLLKGLKSGLVITRVASLGFSSSNPGQNSRQVR